jgi:hypothetical protein
VTGVDPSLSAPVLDYHSTESYAVVLTSSLVTRWRVWRSQYREAARAAWRRAKTGCKRAYSQEIREAR